MQLVLGFSFVNCSLLREEKKRIRPAPVLGLCRLCYCCYFIIPVSLINFIRVIWVEYPYTSTLQAILYGFLPVMIYVRLEHLLCTLFWLR